MCDRRVRKNTGVTPRSRHGTDVTHGLTLIKDAQEQKGRTVKQRQGTCAGCAAYRVNEVALAHIAHAEGLADVPIPRSQRTPYWCRACGIACCAVCYATLAVHGGTVTIPHRMGLFSRPKTTGRTGRNAGRDMDESKADDVSDSGDGSDKGANDDGMYVISR
jgi:hypothetical protein